MAGNGAEALRNSSGALRCFVGVVFVLGRFHGSYRQLNRSSRGIRDQSQHCNAVSGRDESVAKRLECSESKAGWQI